MDSSAKDWIFVVACATIVILCFTFVVFVHNIESKPKIMTEEQFFKEMTK
jgi:hypothetical protein